MIPGDRTPSSPEDIVVPLSDELLENVVGGAGAITPTQLDRLLKGEEPLGTPPVALP